MENPYEERIRIEMSYPQHRAKVFEKIKAGVVAKYPDADVKGKETDRNGSEIMITLATVPKPRREPVEGAVEVPVESKGKPFEFTATSDVHDFVSNLIEEYAQSK